MEWPLDRSILDRSGTASGWLSGTPLLPSAAHLDRLVSVWHALRGKGFSAGEAKRISCQTWGSTSAIYNAHWKKWYFWCQGRGLDPLHPTVPLMNDFFLSL